MIEIIENWSDDLIMCPSQCYLCFKKDATLYCLYIRWRWDDPWTASLIFPLDNTNEDIANADKWNDLEVNSFTHDDLENFKEHALEQALVFIS